MHSKTRDERRQAEIARGQQIAAQRALSSRFNPNHDNDYEPDTHPMQGKLDPRERTIREEYAARMRAQVNRD